MYWQFVRRNSQKFAQKFMTDIDTKILGAGEREILRMMHGRATNMESKNRSGTEGAVKM